VVDCTGIFDAQRAGHDFKDIKQKEESQTL